MGQKQLILVAPGFQIFDIFVVCGVFEKRYSTWYWYIGRVMCKKVCLKWQYFSEEYNHVLAQDSMRRR
jgi:hypothetical protein